DPVFGRARLIKSGRASLVTIELVDVLPELDPEQLPMLEGCIVEGSLVVDWIRTHDAVDESICGSRCFWTSYPHFFTTEDNRGETTKDTKVTKKKTTNRYCPSCSFVSFVV